MTESILMYPDPNLPYMLFTDASRYAWACFLTQEKTHTFEERKPEFYTLLHIRVDCLGAVK